MLFLLFSPWQDSSFLSHFPTCEQLTYLQESKYAQQISHPDCHSPHRTTSSESAPHPGLQLNPSHPHPEHSLTVPMSSVTDRYDFQDCPITPPLPVHPSHHLSDPASLWTLYVPLTPLSSFDHASGSPGPL